MTNVTWRKKIMGIIPVDNQLIKHVLLHQVSSTEFKPSRRPLGSDQGR